MKKLLLASAFIAGFSSLASAQSAAATLPVNKAAKTPVTAAAPVAADAPRFANAKGETVIATPAAAPAPAPAKKAVAKKPVATGKKG